MYDDRPSFVERNLCGVGEICKRGCLLREATGAELAGWIRHRVSECQTPHVFCRVSRREKAEAVHVWDRPEGTLVRPERGRRRRVQQCLLGQPDALWWSKTSVSRPHLHRARGLASATRAVCGFGHTPCTPCCQGSEYVIR